MKIINSVIYFGWNGSFKSEFKQVVNIVEEGVSRNEKFFEIERFPFQVKFLSSREEIDAKKETKTPEWVVGWTNKQNKELFILHPYFWEKESCHPRESFSKVLVHEITHLFTYRLYPFSVPVWLVEGLATYIAEQKQSLEKIDKNLLKEGFLSQLAVLKKYEDIERSQVYRLSYLWIKYLLEEYGKKTFLNFINKLTNYPKDQNEIFSNSYSISFKEAEKRFINYCCKEGG